MAAVVMESVVERVQGAIDLDSREHGQDFRSSGRAARAKNRKSTSTGTTSAPSIQRYAETS